jgi:hypothetical protein
MYPRSFTCSEGGYSIRTGYKRYQNVQLLRIRIRYRWCVDETELRRDSRTTIWYIRRYLSIRSRHVDTNQSSFQSGGALHSKVVGNMYIMVPVTAKLIPLSTDRSETEKIVDLVSKAMERRWATCDIDSEVKHSWPIPTLPMKVVKAAVDAVIDRKTHKELIALARWGGHQY